MLQAAPAEVSKKEECSHDFKDNFDVKGNKQNVGIWAVTKFGNTEMGDNDVIKQVFQITMDRVSDFYLKTKRVNILIN